MALLTMTLLDDYGRTVAKRVEIQPETLLVDILANAQEVIDTFHAISDLGVIRADLIITGALTSYASPTAGANVDVGATFSGYIVDGEGDKASYKVPGVKTSLVDEDGSIDLTQATVAAHLATFAPASEAMLSDEENVTTWIRGMLDK